MKVLVVDDNKKINELFLEYFELSGIKGVFTESAKNLTEIISLEKPDYIILDMAMPKYDGFYGINEMKKSNFDLSKVIVLSAAEFTDTEKQKIKDQGIIYHLEKPTELSILKEIFIQNKKTE